MEYKIKNFSLNNPKIQHLYLLWFKCEVSEETSQALRRWSPRCRFMKLKRNKKKKKKERRNPVPPPKK
jgi:hypothetical protein